MILVGNFVRVVRVWAMRFCDMLMCRVLASSPSSTKWAVVLS